MLLVTEWAGWLCAGELRAGLPDGFAPVSRTQGVLDGWE
jgi:hypothetical protein